MNANGKAARKRSGQVIPLFNSHTLLSARLEDLARLVTLRSGEMNGCRSYAVFLCQYWFTEKYAGNMALALDHAFDLNYQFTQPLPKEKLFDITMDADRFYNHDPLRFSNARLIERLHIQPEEERYLKTIISHAERERRKEEKAAYWKSRGKRK